MFNKKESLSIKLRDCVRKEFEEQSNRLSENFRKEFEEQSNRLSENSRSLYRMVAEELSNNSKQGILLQALCEKYTEGTCIIYDEHHPRELIIIKDGKRIDISDATSISFSWYEGEFPRISIDRK